MITIRVQNQDNLPDFIREFDVTPEQLDEIQAQLNTGVEIVEVHRAYEPGLLMTFPARFWRGVKGSEPS